jgi:hypothetical protein
MPEDMPDRMPECQKICQVECQKICQIECQKVCQIECQKKKSDRMPEDLPVTKCINVMVGITRSKVISLFLHFSSGLNFGNYAECTKMYQESSV